MCIFSFLILRVFLKYDDDLDITYTLNLALVFAFSESIITLLLLMQRDINFIFLIIFGVYLNFTSWMDYLTSCIYDFLNIIMLFILLAEIYIRSRFDLFFVFTIAFVYLFLLICEKIGAFEHGDTDYLLISYLFFSLRAAYEQSVIFVLIVMLLSSTLFEIFRKLTGRKEGVIPYTPFITVSEILITTFIYL